VAGMIINKLLNHSDQKKKPKIIVNFPDPDISPINIDGKWLEKIQVDMPELPQVKIERFKKQYGFSDYDAKILTTNKNIANYTEQVISELRAWVETNDHNWETAHTKLAKLTGNWVGTELFKIP